MRNSKSGKILTTAIVLTAFACPNLLQAGTGTLSVTVHEAGTDTPLPCRAWVEIDGERLF